MKEPLLRYAAIDIGSNAVRLLLCNAVEEHGVIHFKKSELIRIPLRLGEDVFSNGRISPVKSIRLIKTMKAFSLLIDVFEPVSFMVCATASMREALNRDEIVKSVKNETGITIQIIDGKTEAELIYSNHVEENLNHANSYLYIDVGGGSTEITLFDKGVCLASKSFNIGTLRYLQGRIPKERWEIMKSWVKKNCTGHIPITAIGSGGNINKIHKILARKDKTISFERLKLLYAEMKALSVEDRMEQWELNPDRADVIVPAAKIFLTVMKAAAINEILVPEIGLVDGIVHELHEQYKRIRVA